MSDDLTNKTDDELEAIIRRAENTNVPTSLFQRAKIELDLRDRKKSKEQNTGLGDSIDTNPGMNNHKWSEKTWVQLIMLAGAIAGIIEPTFFPTRSEEHTSELQSPDHLVCRLLLEKKKRYTDKLYLNPALYT